MRKMMLRLLAVVLLFVMMTALPKGPAAEADTSVSFKGTVACLGGNKVAGIWVKRQSDGWGAWATSKPRSVAPWISDFTVTVKLKYATDPVQLHIGCGRKSTGSWYSNNQTSYKKVTSTSNFSVVCKERAGTGSARCRDWGTKVLVGMPFTGNWASADVHPSTHHTSGNWSNDIYGVTRPVKIYAFAQRGVTVALRVTSNSRTCGTAGYNAQVEVKRNGTVLGYAKYGHLTSQKPYGSLASGSTLGSTTTAPPPWKSPQYISDDDLCWKGTSAGSIHTHATLKNASGYACYGDWELDGTLRERGQSVTEAQWLGTLGATGATKQKQACP